MFSVVELIIRETYEQSRFVEFDGANLTEAEIRQKLMDGEYTDKEKTDKRLINLEIQIGENKDG